MGSRKILLFLLVLLALVSVSVPCACAAADDAPSSSASKADGRRYVSFDFDNVDIRLFIKYISELTGKDFVVDKSVQGNVTILSPTKISDTEAYRVFESVLEVHGYTTVPSGPIIKIIPSAEARSQNIETISAISSAHPEDKVVTQLVPLKHTSPDQMKKLLLPLVSKSSVVISDPQSGMLILTETLSNIQRLMAIIGVLDVEGTQEELAVLPLKNANATNVAKILASVFQTRSAARGRAAGQEQIKVVPYERVNAVVVLAAKEDIGRVKRLVERLDTPVHRDEGDIHVYYLQNANATELAKVLTALPGSQGAKEQGKAPSISKNVKITADEETNSLLITATREEYHILEGVIKKLDIPRQMVYLEALILEVQSTKNFDVGVEWAAAGHVRRQHRHAGHWF